jgi:glycosyltransferase involved in cell wall biosynthesis
MTMTLGHLVHYRMLREEAARADDVDVRWAEVAFDLPPAVERLADRLPPLRAGLYPLAARQAVTSALRYERPHALLYHTQHTALAAPDLVARHPTVLSFDVSPKQFDGFADAYEHHVDGIEALRQVKHWWNVKLYSLADRCLAWSDWVRRSLTDDYGVPDERIDVVPGGVDLERFTSGERPYRARPRILFIGGDFARKGGPLLLDLYRRRWRDRATIQFVTSHRGEPEAGVIWTPPVANDSTAYRALFDEADLFVFPTEADCLPLAIMEAMASGLPAVSTRVGGIPEMIEDERSGFLAAPGDARCIEVAVDRLLASRELRQQFGVRARELAQERFDGRTNARRLFEVMRRAAAQRRESLACGRL